jgi:hypothetical protein
MDGPCMYLAIALYEYVYTYTYKWGLRKFEISVKEKNQPDKCCLSPDFLIPVGILQSIKTEELRRTDYDVGDC